MRILIVSQHFWPETFRINPLASELHAQGHEVEVLCGSPNYPEGKVFPGYRAWSVRHQMHPDGYELHRVPEFPRGRGGHVRLALNYLSFIFSSVLFGPFLTRGRAYDVVFVYGTSPIYQCFVGLIYRWTKGAKLAVWVQDLWPESVQSTGFVKGGPLMWVFGVLTNAVYRGSDLILAQSRGFQAILEKRVGGRIPVEYFPNPGERMPVEPGVPQSRNQSCSSFDVVFAGNMGTAQSLDTILDAAKRLTGTDIRIVMVGSGSRSDWMRETAEKRGLTNVYFHGRVPAHEMPAIYDQASALLITLKSSANYDITIPSKVQSYLAAGRPIVAAVSGEGGRVVREAEAGFVVEAGDGQGLAEAILRLRALPSDERARMGMSGRQYHEERFAIEVLARQLVDFFRAAIAGNEKKGSSL